jgi:hypothetical protein
MTSKNLLYFRKVNMKTEDELRSYYESEIKPELEKLEEWRKQVLKKAIIVDSIFAPPFVIAVFLIIRYMVNNIIEHNLIFVNSILMVFIVSFLSTGMFLFPYYKVWRTLRYKSKVITTPEGYEITQNRMNELLYKSLIVGKLVAFISPSLHYSPERRKISGEEVLKGELFPHTIFYPEGYIAEDFIEGKIGDLHIRFFEISGKDAIKPTTRTIRGEALDLGGFAWESFSFHGMLGEVDFNKSFKGHTLVLPETKVRQSEWMRGSGRQLIKLEDPEFENLFSVFGTDQITARYLLSTSLMQRIADYRKKIKRKITLSFTGNKLYIAIHHRKNLFEFSMYRSVYDFERIKEFFKDLHLITSIVEDLNLNTQIWLKEDEKESKMFEYNPEYKYKKEWVYKFLMYGFGYLGLHYLYLGYRLKAFVYFCITMTIFPFLIYQIFTVKYPFMNILITFVLGLLWYTYIWHKGHWIDRDSKGMVLQF